MTNFFVANDDVGLHIKDTVMDAVNKVQGFVEGEYGLAHALQIIDDDGVGVDLTTYTGIALRAISADAQKTISISSTGGDSSGNFSITPDTANFFDRDGTWLAQVHLTTATILAMTVPFEVDVTRQL